MKNRLLLITGVCSAIILGGFALIFTGTLFGKAWGANWDSTSWRSGEVRTTSDDLTAFTSMKIDGVTADFGLVYGDRFHIATVYHENIAVPSYEVKDGTLILLEERKRNLNNLAKIERNSVIVTVPSGTEFQSLSVDCSLGNMTFPEVTAADLKLSSDFGELRADQLISSGKAVIDMNCGDVKVQRLGAKELSINNDFGSVEFDGTEGRFDSVDIRMSSGSLTVGNLQAGTLKVRNDFGKVRYGNSTVDTLDIEMSSGDLVLENTSAGSARLESNFGKISGSLDSGSLTAKASSGDVVLTGRFGGMTEIRSDYGSVKLDASDNEPEYRYDLETAFGSILLNGKKQKTENGNTRNTVSGGSGTNQIKIVCSSGNVEVRFGNQ